MQRRGGIFTRLVLLVALVAALSASVATAQVRYRCMDTDD